MLRRLWVSLVAAFLFVAGAPANAQEKRFGEWKVGVLRDSEGIYAATVNDSGGVFGEYCYPAEDACLWLLSNDIKCEDGSKYPVLINASGGAVSTTMMCKAFNRKSVYVFTNFSEVERVLDGATWIGMAFPMQNGLFKVSRFPLDGHARAVAFMEKIAKSMPTSTTRSTSDQVY